MQSQIFQSGEDSPLFSGVAQTVHMGTFEPKQAVRQPGIFTCNYCNDTGKIILNKYTREFRVCWCEAGRRYTDDRSSKDSRIANIGW